MYKIRLCTKIKHQWGYKYVTAVKLEVKAADTLADQIEALLKEHCIKVIRCNYLPQWRNTDIEDVYVVNKRRLKKIYDNLEYTFFDQPLPSCIFLLGDYLKWYQLGYIQIIKIMD